MTEHDDPYMITTTGYQNRPHYIPLHEDWRKHHHTNTKPIENSIRKFCEQIKGTWIDQPIKEKAKPIPNKEFNAGPLSFSKEKLEAWDSRQNVQKPLDTEETPDTLEE